MNRIYIIGNITNPLSIKTRLSFLKHQRVLESFGYEVINPLETIHDINLQTRFDYNKYNLKKLIECNAVYIMSDVSIKKGDNVELKISIDLGLLLLQSMILNSDLDEDFTDYYSELGQDLIV